MHLTQLTQTIIGRKNSLFGEDLEKKRDALNGAIRDSRVLVIGGAGTIGGAFIKKMLQYGTPSCLCIVDMSENGLAELTRDLRSTPHLLLPAVYLTYPVDYGSSIFGKILLRYGPFDIVANFAAHKHVRSEKDALSIEAMLENNVLKTKRLLDLLTPFPPRHFFCVSTDKAANPANVMGASKKLMEEVIRSYSDLFPVTTARFANVLLSNGSLPDGFLRRIALRQPLSLPTDVRRYFVSAEEAGEICLFACLLGTSGDIFFPVLDKKWDVRSFDFIAEQILRHVGREPQYFDSEEAARQSALLLETDTRHYPVHIFQSDTSGEKLCEEFYDAQDTIDTQSYPSLGIIKNTPRKTPTDITLLVEQIESFFIKENIDKQAVIAFLSQLLPSFQHTETHKNLDARM